MSPVPESNAGGVERFCWLLAEILQEQGWRTSIVGPSRQPGRWTFRFGGSPLLWSVSTGRAVAAVTAAGRRPDLIVGNGFLGLSAPRGVPRIQVFHGTSAAEILATRPSLPRRDFLRRLLGYWPLEALMCRAGHLVVVSESAGEETARYYRRTAARVIPNGVDTDIFHPRDRLEAREQLGLEQRCFICPVRGTPRIPQGRRPAVRG